MDDTGKKLTVEEFTLRAIKNLRKEGKGGIHSVFSGFNEAFKKYFGLDPVLAIVELERQGKIVTRPAAKTKDGTSGSILYLPGEELNEEEKRMSALASGAFGTYARVIQNSPSFSGIGDAYLVLYLQPSGLYLFIGYWRGFELTVAAGHWKERDEHVLLKGVGAHLLMDVVPFSRIPRIHERDLSVVIENYSRALFAETEHEGWSLLSWRGYLHYLGRFHFFNLGNDELPTSIAEVEPWTQRFLDRCGFQTE